MFKGISPVVSLGPVAPRGPVLQAEGRVPQRARFSPLFAQFFTRETPIPDSTLAGAQRVAPTQALTWGCHGGPGMWLGTARTVLQFRVGKWRRIVGAGPAP